MKKALVLFYSQAGQTQQAIETFVRGLAPELACHIVSIKSREEFSFPWTMSKFFRVFPRSVQGVAPETEPLNVDWENYDLVILGYQVWFLSPSLPIQGFFKSKDAENLRGKKVITVLTCRNLWYSASSWIQERLRRLGAIPLGQVTVCELSPILASFITTPRWMLTGKKNPFFVFPAAGISERSFQSWKPKAERSEAPGSCPKESLWHSLSCLQSFYPIVAKAYGSDRSPVLQSLGTCHSKIGPLKKEFGRTFC